MKQFITCYYPGIFITLLFVVISIFTCKDYGIAWDEGPQREIGMISYNFIEKNDTALRTYAARDHGTGFELPLYYAEQWLHLKNSRSIYIFRHRVSHYYFLFGAFCGYILAYRLFKNRWIAVLGLLLFLMHPRIYAHSFFNTKDVTFLTSFLISFLLCQLAFEKKQLYWFFLLGLAVGYAASIRIMGVVLLPCIFGFLVIDFFTETNQKKSRIALAGVLFIVGFCSLLYAIWPVLWHHPITYFSEQFATSAHYPWVGKILLNGTEYQSNAEPWYYIPEWFAITMPEFCLLAGLGGFVWIVVAFLKAPKKLLLNNTERNFLLYAICFAGPIVAVIAIHSIVYDDWRHLYFIYPSFVQLMLYFVNSIWQTKKSIIIPLLAAGQLSYLAFFFIKVHPYQQVYFNYLVSHDDEYLRKHFDMEYWGCSFKEGMEYLVAHDKRESIRVDWSSDPVVNAILFLPDSSMLRIQLVDRLNKPEYFLTTFRNHPGDYTGMEVLYEKKVLNSTIFRLYKKPGPLPANRTFE